eukprot:1592066-Amphidinium_carterae.1
MVLHDVVLPTKEPSSGPLAEEGPTAQKSVLAQPSAQKSDPQAGVQDRPLEPLLLDSNLTTMEATIVWPDDTVEVAKMVPGPNGWLVAKGIPTQLPNSLMPEPTAVIP